MKQDFKLEDIPKSNPYQVPPDYFNKLPQVVMTRVTAPKPAEASNWWSTLLYSYRTGLASIILLIGFVAAFLFSPSQPGVQSLDSVHKLANINQQEALEYVLVQDNIDSGDLAELNLTDKDVSAEFINATSSDILETVDEQQLEEVYYN